MKQIKLFENWAEEIKAPEYLDSNISTLKRSKTKKESITTASEVFINNVKLDKCKFAAPNYLNLKNFYETDQWKSDGYDELSINQEHCQYKLQDFKGLPEIRSKLALYNTEIKSFKSLESKEPIPTLILTKSYIENLKYCPRTARIDLRCNPLLSYYGIKTREIVDHNSNLCGYYCYYDSHNTYHSNNIVNNSMNLKFHSEMFCNFHSDARTHTIVEQYSAKNLYYSNGMAFNPWEQCYYDPNEVENFEFLFYPFWKESEKFREKAKMMINDPEIDLLNRRADEELW